MKTPLLMAAAILALPLSTLLADLPRDAADQQVLRIQTGRGQFTQVFLPAQQSTATVALYHHGEDSFFAGRAAQPSETRTVNINQGRGQMSHIQVAD